jgi:H+/Cl- antiporter ClcA
VSYFRLYFQGLILAGVLGFLTIGFYGGLQWIQNFQALNTTRYYVLVLPAVWLLLYFFKRASLYYPVSISSAVELDALTFKQSSPWALPQQVFGALASHFAGASLGREALVVIMAHHLAQILRFDFKFFRPVVLATGFATATGMPLVGLVFALEVFSTSLFQKLLILLMSWVGCLVVESFHVEPLLAVRTVELSYGFWQSLGSVILMASVIGISARFYKWAYFQISERSKKLSWWSGVLFSSFLALILFQPQFHLTHSLSLDLLQQLQVGQGSTGEIGLKFVVTLICVGLGFWGGEFVPSLIIGAGLGVLGMKELGLDPQWGLLLGTFAFFAGLTRLKWTAFFLAGFTFGFFHFVWLYLFLTIVRWFSGSSSLYKSSARV